MTMLLIGRGKYNIKVLINNDNCNFMCGDMATDTSWSKCHVNATKSNHILCKIEFFADLQNTCRMHISRLKSSFKSKIYFNEQNKVPENNKQQNKVEHKMASL